MHLTEDLPIALFDSGVGGLTVMQEVAALLPQENLLYLGDTARVPYGNRSPQAILRYTLENVSFLIEKKIKLLIIACHTACAHSLEELQKRFSIPIMGVIQPGFEKLMEATRTHKVAILGTASTIGSGIYPSLIRQQSPKTEVISIACPLFVPLIEEGLLNHRFTREIAEYYLAPLKEQKIDVVLLACTHYPLLRPIIQQVLGPEIALIEPAKACALQVKEWLQTASLFNRQTKKPHFQFYATDDPQKFQRLAKSFFNGEIKQVCLFNNEWH